MTSTSEENIPHLGLVENILDFQLLGKTEHAFGRFETITSHHVSNNDLNKTKANKNKSK